MATITRDQFKAALSAACTKAFATPQERERVMLHGEVASATVVGSFEPIDGYYCPMYSIGYVYENRNKLLKVLPQHEGFADRFWAAFDKIMRQSYTIENEKTVNDLFKNAHLFKIV